MDIKDLCLCGTSGLPPHTPSYHMDTNITPPPCPPITPPQPVAVLKDPSEACVVFFGGADYLYYQNNYFNIHHLLFCKQKFDKQQQKAQSSYQKLKKKRDEAKAEYHQLLQAINSPWKETIISPLSTPKETSV